MSGDAGRRSMAPMNISRGLLRVVRDRQDHWRDEATEDRRAADASSDPSTAEASPSYSAMPDPEMRRRAIDLHAMRRRLHGPARG
jgi:hypothetical protein